MKGLSLKRTAAVVLTSALLFTNNILNVAALDSKDVSYQGVTGKVEVASQNLFEGMEGLLPGDVVGRSINLRNNSSDDLTFYLLAEPSEDYANADEMKISQELISLLNLKLELTTPAGATSVVYSGPLSGDPKGAADTVGTMVTPITLGRLSAQQSGVLHATVSVPTTLGNRYQNIAGKINWSFYCDVSSSGDSGGDSGGSSGGNSGGNAGTNPGGNSGTGGATTEIKEPEVPLIDNGVDISEPAVPKSGINPSTEELKDQPTPLSGVLIVVDDKTLGNLPKTGGMQIPQTSKSLGFTLAVVLAGGLGVVICKKKKVNK